MGGLYEPEREVTDISECIFYHHIDLPEVGEVGHGWDLRPTIDDYLGNVDFSGKRVYDVGTAGGFLTFAIEKRGGTVVSFDMRSGDQWNIVPYAWPNFDATHFREKSQEKFPRVQNGYWFAHRLLESNAKVHYGDIYNHPEELGMFDVVVLGMVLPHLRDPFQALFSASLRCSDTLIIAQPVNMSEQPLAAFIPNVKKDPGSRSSYDGWWMLSAGCLKAMLNVLNFEIESIITQQHLCTSTTPPNLVSSSAFVARRCNT